jgi:hypothetical protein
MKEIPSPVDVERLLRRVSVVVVTGVALTIAFFVVGTYVHSNGMLLAVLLIAGTAAFGGWLITQERSKDVGFGVLVGLTLAVLGQVIFFLAFLSWLGGRTT